MIEKYSVFLKALLTITIITHLSILIIPSSLVIHAPGIIFLLMFLGSIIFIRHFREKKFILSESQTPIGGLLSKHLSRTEIKLQAYTAFLFILSFFNDLPQYLKFLNTEGLVLSAFMTCFIMAVLRFTRLHLEITAN